MTDSKDLEITGADVSCPGCKTLYNNPKILPCLHCLCKVCSQKTSECPVCAKKYHTKQLPDAHFKLKMVKLYKHVEAKDKGCCEECNKSPVKLNFSCSQCGFICDDCTKHHRALKTYKTHEVKDVTKLDRSNSLASLRDADANKIMCSAHDEYILNIYCKECKRLVCKECTSNDHKPPTHSCVPLSACFMTQKDELTKKLQLLCDHQKKFYSDIAETNTKKETVGQHQVLMEKMISTSFDEIAAKMKELKINLLQKMKNEISATKKQLQEQESSIKENASEIDEVVKLTIQYVKNSTDQQFVSASEYVFTRMQEAMKMKVPDEETRIMERLSALFIDCEKCIMDICHNHLEQTFNLSIEQSKVSHLPQHARVDNKTKFVVHAVTKSKLPCVKKQQIEVEVRVKRTGDIIISEVNSGQELGTYNVVFTPAVKGQHEIAVKIEDHEVRGSPFHIKVKPQALKWTKPSSVFTKPMPWGVACTQNGTVYVTLHFQHKIAIIDQNGKNKKEFLVSVKGHREGQIWSPTGIAVDKDNFVYVADNARVQKLSSGGQFCAEYKHLSAPKGVMVNDTHVYVCDSSAIIILDKDLRFTGRTITDHIQSPHSICNDTDGKIYVTDRGRILIFSHDGNFLRKIEHLDLTPTGICVDDDNMFVCNDNKIEIFSTTGEKIETCGHYGKNEGEFHSPMGIAVDFDNYFYVCDYSNSRVQVF